GRVTGDGSQMGPGQSYRAWNEIRAHRDALLALVRVMKEALERCKGKLTALGREFTGDRFTDRHGDGPECLALAEQARAALAAARKEDGKQPYKNNFPK